MCAGKHAFRVKRVNEQNTENTVSAHHIYLKWTEQERDHMTWQSTCWRGLTSLGSRNNRLHRNVKISRSHANLRHIDQELVCRLINLWILPSEGGDSCLSAQRLEVGSTIADGEISQLGDEGGTQGRDPLTGVDGEDGGTILRRWEEEW